MELIQHGESDAWLSLGLSFYLNVLPLTRQLSELSGSLWSKALQVVCYVESKSLCLLSLYAILYGVERTPTE